MQSTEFEANEAGFTYRYDASHDSASALYIKNMRDVKLQAVKFKLHKKTNFIDLVPFERNITNGLPRYYFENSHSPVIRIKQ